MTVKIEYKISMLRDLGNIDKREANRILNKIEKELKNDPDMGEHLKGISNGLLKLKVGDYRVLYTRTIDGVRILRIGH